MISVPEAGDIAGQVQAGVDLISALAQVANGTLDASALVENGISIAGEALSGGITAAADVVGAVTTTALSGLAMTGPTGAAIADAVAAGVSAATAEIPVVGEVVAVVAAVIEILAAYVGGGVDSVDQVLGASKATAQICGSIGRFSSSHKSLSGNPIGWEMADYLAFVRPPSSSTSPEKFKSLMSEVAQFYISKSNSYAPELNQSNDTNNIVNAINSFVGVVNSSLPIYTAEEFLSWQVPLCTPVWFDWYKPTGIEDCNTDLTFGGGGDSTTALAQWQAMVSSSAAQKKLSAWLKATPSVGGLSPTQIVQMAMVAPLDPLYWSSDLYGMVGSSGSADGFATVYYNVDLMNGIATHLMMRASGASPMGVLSELLMQSALLSQYGGTDSSGNSIPNVSKNQYGFHRLVDDYITYVNALGYSQSLSTAGMVGAVVAGAAGATLVGILGYSLWKRQSPLVTVGQAKSKIIRVGGRYL